MKFLKVLFVASFVNVVKAASPAAALLTFGNHDISSSSSSQLQTVTPETTRLILARRLGLSQFHKLAGLAEAAIEQINDFGNLQQPLLSDNDPEGSRFVIVVEGVEDISDYTSQSQISPSFFISDPPTSSANDKLLSDLTSQIRSLSWPLATVVDLSVDKSTFTADVVLDANSGSSDKESCTSKLQDVKRGLQPDAAEFELLQALTSPEVTYRCGSVRALIHLTRLQKLAKQYGTSGAIYKDAVKHTWDALSRLVPISETDNVQFSIILMPHNTRNAKRTDQPYGAYTLPAARSTKPRSSENEVPLSDVEELAKPSSSPFEDTAVNSNKGSKGFPIFRGPIASCYLSEDECVSATRNCSGRATCYRKSTSDKIKKGRDCWACSSCKPTVLKHNNATQTIYWGGAACQKQDVGTPFLLIAGFSILLVGAVTWGVGMLYSIGQEPLPGVIGAGVAVTRPR